MSISSKRLKENSYVISILCFCFSIGIGIFNVNANNKDITNVSIINLIATPEKYHHKKVRFEGVASIDPEHQAIYLSKNDADRFITKNSVRLLLNENDLIQYVNLNLNYVIIEGVFNAEFRGFADSYSGAIKKITRLELWTISRKKELQ